jgi:uncharacterized protein YfaS (alpha-2-macroglobulin family)
MPHLGETYRVYAYSTFYDGKPLTPDSHEVTFYDPTGALMHTDTSPINEADGVYYSPYTFPEDGHVGRWVAKWKVTKAGATRKSTLAIPVTSA